MQTLRGHEHDLGTTGDLRCSQRHRIDQNLPYPQRYKFHSRERKREFIERKRERWRWNLWRWAFGHEWGHWWGVGEGIWGEWWWSRVREWAELICRWTWLRSLCPCSRLCLFHSDRLHRPPPLLCFCLCLTLREYRIVSYPRAPRGCTGISLFIFCSLKILFSKIFF